MNPLFLLALKKHLEESLADLTLESRDSTDAPRQVQIFIGDLPPKKRRPGSSEKKDTNGLAPSQMQGASGGKATPEKLDDYFPCVVLVPASGQLDSGEDVVTVAVIYGVYCPEDGDAEGAEMDHGVLLSRIKQSLYPCLKSPLDARYRLTEDAKGRLFPWEKSDLQPRPYIQSTLMTHWRMKGLE